MTENREHRYILRGNIVHVDPREECNLDDTEAEERIDPATAHALIEHEAARYCEHCGLRE